MNETPESSSPSTTTPEPTKRLTGKDGLVYLDGKPIGATQWSLNVKNKYPNASAFGELNKHYVAGLKDISGTFSGMLDLEDQTLIAFGDTQTHVMFYHQPRPAWWGRLKHWLLRSEWPSHVLADGDGKVSFDQTIEPKGDIEYKGGVEFDSPVVLYVPPMSRLERIWDRMLHPRRWR